MPELLLVVQVLLVLLRVVQVLRPPAQREHRGLHGPH
jgi:hypothetical protein